VVDGFRCRLAVPAGASALPPPPPDRPSTPGRDPNWPEGRLVGVWAAFDNKGSEPIGPRVFWRESFRRFRRAVRKLRQLLSDCYASVRSPVALDLLLWRLNRSDTLCDRQEEHRKRKPQHDRNEPSELGAVRVVFNIQEPFQDVHRRNGYYGCE